MPWGQSFLVCILFTLEVCMGRGELISLYFSSMNFVVYVLFIIRILVAMQMFGKLKLPECFNRALSRHMWGRSDITFHSKWPVGWMDIVITLVLLYENSYSLLCRRYEPDDLELQLIWVNFIFVSLVWLGCWYVIAWTFGRIVLSFIACALRFLSTGIIIRVKLLLEYLRHMKW